MTIDLNTIAVIALGENPHFTRNVLTLPSIKAPRPYGCGLMQFSAKTLALAASTNDTPTLIVEHDATPTAWHKSVIEVPDDADVVYLGWSRYRPSVVDGKAKLVKDGPVVLDVEGWPGVVRVMQALATHAILYVTRRGLLWSREANIRCAVDRRPSDVCMAESMAEVNAYGLRQPLFFQGPKGKNINATATLFEIA